MFKLFETIQNLRNGAALLFDNARLNKIPAEKIQEEMKPLVDAQVASIKQATLAECIECVMAFDAVKRSYEEQAGYLVTKSQEAEFHGNMVRAEIIERMKAAGRDEMRDGDRSATLVIVDGNEALTLR